MAPYFSWVSYGLWTSVSISPSFRNFPNERQLKPYQWAYTLCTILSYNADLLGSRSLTFTLLTVTSVLVGAFSKPFKCYVGLPSATPLLYFIP